MYNCIKKNALFTQENYKKESYVKLAFILFFVKGVTFYYMLVISTNYKNLGVLSVLHQILLVFYQSKLTGKLIVPNTRIDLITNQYLDCNIVQII